MQQIKDLFRGIRRHPFKFIGYVFAGFSMAYTLAKGVTFFVPGIKIEGPSALVLSMLASIGYACWKVWKPSQIEIKVHNTNTSIEVAFGDLFAQDGIRVIAVNEFWDSMLGRPVSEKSLHGIFLKKCFGGHPEPFDKQVAEQLEGQLSTEFPQKEGKTKRFEIGTTAIITVDRDRYLAFAFARTIPESCKASCDVTTAWTALHCLWQRARIEAGGYAINLPLVGSGLSGLNLPTRDLLNLIILSIITETKAKQITGRLRVVLHRDRFEDVDLRAVKSYWEE